MANEPKITNDVLVKSLREWSGSRRRDVELVSKRIKAAVDRFDSEFQDAFSSGISSSLFVEDSRTIRAHVDHLVGLCEALREQARIETLLVDAGVLAQRS